MMQSFSSRIVIFSIQRAITAYAGEIRLSKYIFHNCINNMTCKYDGTLSVFLLHGVNLYLRSNFTGLLLVLSIVCGSSVFVFCFVMHYFVFQF